jgi:hypothetical protein
MHVPASTRERFSPVTVTGHTSRAGEKMFVLLQFRGHVGPYSFASVVVPMMHIRIMSMNVRQRLVHMDVRMRLLAIPRCFIRRASDHVPSPLDVVVRSHR